jgi:hypothetical protein
MIPPRKCPRFLIDIQVAEDIERDGEISLSFLIPFFLNPPEASALTANFDPCFTIG